MPDGNAYTPFDRASVGSDPECFAISEIPATEIKRGGARPGAGRPRIEGERPWDAEGISRATYYRRQAPAPAYATDTPAWRVLATWGQAERSAAQELTRQGYETYLPLIAIRRRDPVIASQWHEVRVPLFPGYAFIRLRQHEAREPITTTRGVRELLHRPDGRLSAVSDGEIDRMRAGDEARLRLPKEHGSVLAAGAVIRVLEGAFAGHSGAVVECDGIRTMAELVLFNRPTRVWLDRVAVVPA